MRLRPMPALVASLALFASGLVLPSGAAAVDLAPRANASGTPLQILGTVPATNPLRVGYKRGSFPVINPVKKDRRGCTLRNQLLIKTAVRKPKVGRGCKLTGGVWALDFGKKVETNPAKVRLVRLLPDVYVYGQGAYMWTPAQRAAYSTYVAPQGAVRPGSRGLIQNSIEQSSWMVATPSSEVYIRKLLALFNINADPDQLALDRLRDLNPTLFRDWTIATLLNAKAWGFSLSPFTYSAFQVNINGCSEDPAKNNPCTQTYTVTTPSAEDPTKPGTTTTYNTPNLPPAASSIAPLIPGIVQGYGQPPTGDVVSRHLFGIHAPATWFYDEAQQVDGPVDPRTIPSVPVGYVRLWDTETTWSDLEPTKGTWVWRKLDKQIQVAQQRDAKVMMVLGGTPGWASANGQKTGNPNSVDDWRTYVRTVCEKYGPSINAYEIWNEANLTTFYAGTPAQMADLTKAAFEEIRRCNPGALVVAANTTSRAEGSFATFFPAYLQELKARGWPADAYSVHSYPKAAGGNGDRIAGIGQFRLMLALAGAPFTTVFDTEVNYGMEGLGQGKVDITGEKAGALMSRTYIDSVRYGFGSTFWYVWTSQPDPKMGIQFTPDAAVEKRAWNKTYEWLVGAQFHACAAAPFNSPASGALIIGKDLVVCQFDRGGSPFALAWYGDVTQGASTTLTPGFFNGLGSQCESLLGGDCSGILAGTAPLTSTPIKISGPALPTIDLPTSIVLRPQPLPTIYTGQNTPITIIATNSEGKYLANEKLSVTLEGPVSLDGDKGPTTIITGANGQFTINIKGEADGAGKLIITSDRNPSLKVTADLTVAPQQVVVLRKIVNKDGMYTVTGDAIGFPDGYLPGTKRSWKFFTVSVPPDNSVTEGMLPIGSKVESNAFKTVAGTTLQIEARLYDFTAKKVVAKIVSNRLQVPLRNETRTFE